MLYEANAGRVGLPRPVRVFLGIQLSLGLLAIAAYLIISRLIRPVTPWRYDYFWPLGKDPHFIDLICFSLRFQHFHTPSFFSMDPALVGNNPPFEYPAPAAFLYRFFYAFHHAIRWYLGFLLLSLAGLAWTFGREMIRRGIRPLIAVGFLVATALLSYPLWFEFGCANMEYCIFLILALGIISFCAEKPMLAAIFFGTAGSMKLFPFVFLSLLLPKKQYKAIVGGIVFAILLTLVGLWDVCPPITFANRGINAGLAVNRHVYMLQVLRLETSFDHSLFGFVKRIAYERRVHFMPDWGLKLYMGIVALAGCLLYFGRIRKLPTLNQITSLYVIAILFPPTSHDYTLIHLYVPLALLTLYSIDCARNRYDAPGLMAAFVCLAIACSAENELIHNHMGFAAQVKCLALLALLYVTVTHPWKHRFGTSEAVLA